MLYLASAYSHPDPAVKEHRYRVACRAAARLMQQGRHVFCPIAATHGIHVHGGLDMSWDYWEPYDRLWLSKCDELVVLTMDGWRESVGVQAEIQIARELGLPITYMAWGSDEV